MSTWIQGCSSSGYQAVEIDNLDSYTRSQGLLTMDHAADMEAILADKAHAEGLAIA